MRSGNKSRHWLGRLMNNPVDRILLGIEPSSLYANLQASEEIRKASASSVALELPEDYENLRLRDIRVTYFGDWSHFLEQQWIHIIPLISAEQWVNRMGVELAQASVNAGWIDNLIKDQQKLEKKLAEPEYYPPTRAFELTPLSTAARQLEIINRALDYLQQFGEADIHDITEQVRETYAQDIIDHVTLHVPDAILLDRSHAESLQGRLQDYRCKFIPNY
jgi:hypothetical protein